MFNRRFGIAAIALIGVLGISACGSSSTGKGSDGAAAPPSASATNTKAMPSKAPSSHAVNETGAYVSWEEYQANKTKFSEGKKVVLFFHAAWCPSCRASDKSLQDSGVPDGLTVVNVNFDDATDLRKTYGVTTQHTFVQVDSAGKEVHKFTGAVSGADIASKIK